MQTEQHGLNMKRSAGSTTDERKRSTSAGDEPSTDGARQAKRVPNTKLVELRISRGWTQDQVAHAIADLAAANGKTTGITANTVSRLERGQCSWPHSLVTEFENLFGLPAADLGFVNRRVGGGIGGYHGAGQDSASCRPPTTGITPRASSSGDSSSDSGRHFEAPSPDIYSPMLAAYGTPQLYMLANNKEYRRAFPGITVGTNLLEWAVFNPLAREVLVEWALETELLASAMREAASETHNSESRAILRKCRDESPEFREIVDRGDAISHRPYSYQLLRDPDCGEIRRVDCTIWVAYTNGEQVHFYIGKPLDGPTRN
ncbi:helix-turn-helix domain-containing protein [Nocardia wallacei]|uniref:helix-turn-helix domain-containing protein n=1 Tax=Nocardia wallacei TaxID=480035 RepID=UPI002453906F|nr:hypothetical protein [Nocardia wallacei]